MVLDKFPQHEAAHIAPLETDPQTQGKRGWQLEINGQEVTAPIETARLHNPNMGVDITYGMRPEGFDGPVIHEPEGGGSVTVPYMINPEDGQIYIGVVRQKRPLAGGIIDNVPRGFVDPGNTHAETAVQELAEETGLRAVFSRFHRIASGININSAFFNTSGVTSTGEPEGTSFYALRVLPEELEHTETEGGNSEYRFRQDIRDESQGDKTTEGIMSTRFVPLHEATTTSPDAYTSMAAGLLVGHLMGRGALKLAGVEDPR